MDNFSELKQLARDKRDAAIAAVKAEYRKELVSINELQKSLTEKPSLKGRPKPEVPMWAQIMDVVPTDANFTVPELPDLLNLPASETPRVRTTIDRLINRRELKRIRRGRRGTPALFAVDSFGPPTNPLNDMSQIDAAEAVLRSAGRPMTLTELVVDMLERGYEPVSGKLKLRKSLGATMTRSVQFVRQGEKWSENTVNHATNDDQHSAKH